MNDTERTELEVLLKEYDLVTNEIKSRIGTNERIMGLGLTILGLGFTLAIKEKVNEILLFMPIGLLALLFYSLLNNTAIYATGGYRYYLQERINRITGKRILIGEIMAAKLVHRNFIFIPLYGIYALILIVSIFMSLRSAWQQFGVKIFISTVVIIGSLLLLFMISVFKWSKIFREANQLAWKESNYMIVEMPPK